MKTFQTIILIIMMCVLLVIVVIQFKKEPKPQTGVTTTVFYPDGSIESISKDGVLIFKHYINGNIGIGNGGHDGKLLIHGNGTIESMSPEQYARFEKGLPKETININGYVGGPNGCVCTSQKLIITSDDTIRVEPMKIKHIGIGEDGYGIGYHKHGDPIGDSKPMKRLYIPSIGGGVSVKIKKIHLYASDSQKEIFQVNHDSTIITFAGHKYIKQQ